MIREFPNQLLVVEHHRQDTLVNDFADQRAAFYNVGPIPHVVFDGENQRIGASSCSAIAGEYRNMIHSRLTETGGVSPLAIAGYHMIVGATLEAAARIELLDPVTLNNPQAFLVVIENDVLVGATRFDYVTRDGYQEAITLGAAGATVTVSTTFAIDPAWNTGQLQCIAFVQMGGGTKDIYQSALLPFVSASVEESVRPALTQRLRMAPNPVNLSAGPRADAVTFRIDLREAGDGAPVKLELIDATGRVVRRLYEDPAASGTLSLSWDGRTALGRPVSSGAYLARLTTAAGTVQGRLVVLR